MCTNVEGDSWVQAVLCSADAQLYPSLSQFPLNFPDQTDLMFVDLFEERAPSSHWLRRKALIADRGCHIRHGGLLIHCSGCSHVNSGLKMEMEFGVVKIRCRIYWELN